jgi:cytochrome c oxidase assembly protein subunit 15
MASAVKPIALRPSDVEPAGLAIKRPSLALRRFAWGLLAYNVLVILWGAVVRATSSGAGCGAHWPLCNGSVVQHHPAVATIIEFAHRASSGLCLPAVFLLVAWTYRMTIRGAWARVTTAAAVVLTLNEALLGALLVLLRHVAKDQSAARSVYLALHLTNTLLMLAALALSAHFLATTAASRYQTRIGDLGTALPGLLATLVVCVFGAWAALSDTLFPAQTLSSALLQDFAPHTHWLIRLRIFHPLSAMVATLFIAWLAFRSVTATHVRPHRPLALAMLLLLGFQIALGLADVTLLAPVWMQVLHLLGADLYWIALVATCAGILRPQQA